MRILARVLLGVGVFLLVAGIMAIVWAPGVVEKTPLDVNSTTILDGTGAKIDPATGEFESRPIYVYSLTRSDSEKSSSDRILFVQQSCVVFDTGQDRTCVDGSDPDLINASIDVFATDRHTGYAVEDANLPPEAVPHDGLVNKFPFETAKRTYPYWDGTLGETVDMVYDRTETLDGLQTYVFKSNVEDAPIDIAEGVPGTYSNAIEAWVEPSTGAIVDQTQQQQRYLEDGTPALDIDVSWTDETVEASIGEAEDNAALLTLVTTTVPIVGFAGGALLILLGGLLLVRRPQPGTRVADRDAGRVSV